MKNLLSTIILTITALTFFSCGKKEDKTNIIVKQEPSKKVAKIQEMEDISSTNTVSWLGNEYTITTNRKADKSLPLTKDEYGNKYYDNIIVVKILRKDKTEFFSRTFKKSDFNSCLDEETKTNGALLGLVFCKTQGNNVIMGGSIGSPNMLSDLFIPVSVTINNIGSVTIKMDKSLDDIENNGAKTQEEMWAEDGV